MLKVSKYGVFSGPNTGKRGQEKTPYLDTFHAVSSSLNTLLFLALLLHTHINERNLKGEICVGKNFTNVTNSHLRI